MTIQRSKRARDHARQARYAFKRRWQRHMGEPRTQPASPRIRHGSQPRKQQARVNWRGVSFAEYRDELAEDGVRLRDFSRTRLRAWWLCGMTAEDIEHELDWERGSDAR